jgi:heat shock protein HtpX
MAVTAGLLSKLNRDQLQGVIAHEMSHILNRDILFMTMAGVMLGSIVMLSEVFLRGMWYSGGGRRYSSGRSSGRGGGQGQAVMMIIALVLAILAPILARLLYFAISRRREYLADATGVRLTRYPEGLASALELISKNSEGMESVNKVTAPMYIVNPLKGAMSTHPPIEKRIQILRSMSGGANYRDYQNAYSQVLSSKAAIIPASGMADMGEIKVREGAAGQAEGSAKKSVREVGDLMRAVNKYAFLACACGLKIKVPPDYKKEQVTCPRCGRALAIPVVAMTAMGAIGDKLGNQKPEQKPEEMETEQTGSTPITYIRKGAGWETFMCKCGNMMQLSPIFAGKEIQCSNCGREIKILDNSKIS